MAGKSINDILYRFLADTKSLEKGNKKAQSGFKKTNQFATTLTKAVGALGVAFGAREMLQWGKDAIGMAVAAQEVDSKFEAVFGTATELNNALREWGDIAGVTETKGRDLAATFGNLAMAQGISREDTEKLTLKVAELAGDLASFNDADPETVFFDLNKALLTTEREGMKKYGIALTETEIKQEAMRIAVADGRTEFTKADKALASYNLAVQQAGQANGDLERTADSTANMQRKLTATMKETQEEIGNQLLPAYNDLLTAVTNLTPEIVGLTGALGGYISEQTAFTSGLATATDNTQSWTDRLKGAYDSLSDLLYAGLKWNVATGPMIRGLEDVAVKTGLVADSAKEAAEKQWELSQGAHGAHEKLAETVGISGPYLEFLALMREGVDGASSSLDELKRSAERSIDALLEVSALRGAWGSGTTQGIKTSGGIQGFATGGTVPGPKGSPQLAVVHGGEQVLTPGQQSSGGKIVVNFNGVVGDPAAVAQQIADLLEINGMAP